MLDEPTAALGVEQTAQVLDLVERLREPGLGVILISHNMADVKAVADRVAVLRLGRNAAEFRVEEATTDAAHRRHHRRHRQRRRRRAPRAQRRLPTRREPRMTEVKDPDAQTPTSAVAADLADERLILSRARPATLHEVWQPAQGR